MKEKDIRKILDFIKEKKYLPGRSADGKPCHESWPNCIFIKKCESYEKADKGKHDSFPISHFPKCAWQGLENGFQSAEKLQAYEGNNADEKKAYSCETAGLFDVGHCCASCDKYEEFLIKEIKKAVK